MESFIISEINLREIFWSRNVSCFTKIILLLLSLSSFRDEGKFWGTPVSKSSAKFRYSSLIMLPKTAFLMPFSVIWLWLRSSFSSSDSSLKTSVGITNILLADEYNSLRAKWENCENECSSVDCSSSSSCVRSEKTLWGRTGGLTFYHGGSVLPSFCAEPKPTLWTDLLGYS